MHQRMTIAMMFFYLKNDIKKRILTTICIFGASDILVCIMKPLTIQKVIKRQGQQTKKEKNKEFFNIMAEKYWYNRH